MSFRIESQGVQLQVRIENDSQTGQQVLDAVHACKALSWWSCPSGECSKIGSCESRIEESAVVLMMTPRAGETLSPTGVQECLRYVLGGSVEEAAH